MPVVPRELRNHFQLRSHFLSLALYLCPPAAVVHRVLALARGVPSPHRAIGLVRLQQRYTNITFV